MSKGGGGSPDSVTQNTSSLPEYAEPYYKDMLARTGYETAQEYTPYGGQRIQDFGQSEYEGMKRMEELGVSGPSDDANNAMYGATQVSLGNPYTDNMLDSTNWSQQALGAQGAYQNGYQANDIWSKYQGPQSYRPGYSAGQRDSGYTAEDMGSAGQYDPTKFNPDRLNNQELLQTYMDPYQQMVTDVNKREAVRDSDVMGRDMSLAAAGEGGLGGYREAIMQAERQRNLGQNLSDIQTRGTQDAYRNAEQSLGLDRDALFGAHTDYEQGLQASGGMGLNRYGMGQSARQAQEQFGQGAFNSNEQMRQAQEEFQFGAWNAQEQAKQEAGNQGLNAQQIEEAGRRAMEEFNLQGRDQDYRNIMGMSELGQSTYGNLLQGDDQRLRAMGQMSGMDQQRQSMEIERLLGMQTAGQIQREMQQRGLDMGYQDFQNQRDWGMQQIGRYSNILQGLPASMNQTQSSYGDGASGLQQALGTGIAGVGLYNAYR